MGVLLVHKVSGLQPRQYGEPLNWEQRNEPVTDTYKLRNATEDELLDAGFKTELVEVDGRDCIKKSGKLIWCE